MDDAVAGVEAGLGLLLGVGIEAADGASLPGVPLLPSLAPAVDVDVALLVWLGLGDSTPIRIRTIASQVYKDLFKAFPQLRRRSGAREAA